MHIQSCFPVKAMLGLTNRISLLGSMVISSQTHSMKMCNISSAVIPLLLMHMTLHLTIRRDFQGTKDCLDKFLFYFFLKLATVQICSYAKLNYAVDTVIIL